MKRVPSPRASSPANRLRLSAVLLALALPLSAAAQQAESYEAGRGLISLEGPSGMFINPTSATLPEGASTVQYCIFFPNNETDVIGNGLMGTYGLTDELEIGAYGNLVVIDEPSKERAAAGPIVRYRLTKDEGAMPQTAVGAYGRYGDNSLNKTAVFAAAYKRVPIGGDDSPIRSVGFHAGVRNVWFDSSAPEDTSFAGYGGAELQLPLRLYLVGEVQTKDSDINTDTPYAFGVQWRAPGIAMSLAGIQNGNVDDPSFYYGIGVAF